MIESVYDIAANFAGYGIDSAVREASVLVSGAVHDLAAALQRGISLGSYTHQGGVSYAVAAYLETKGMVDQGKILADFKTQLEWIAALGYLFALCMGIGAVAVFGNYKQGMYFMIGPPLFYFMVNTTADTDGTVLRVGNRIEGAKNDQQAMLTWARALTDGQTAKVSLFFAVWDNIVTEVTQAVVGVFLNEENKQDMRVVARERALNFVLHGSPENGGFVRLVGASFWGECGNLQGDDTRSYAMRMRPYVDFRPKDDMKYSQERRKEKADDPVIGLDTEAKRFLIAMRDSYPGEEFADVLWQKPEDVAPIVSCNQIWRWVGESCKKLAQSKLRYENFAGLTGEDPKIPWDQVYDDVKKWLASIFRGQVQASQDEKATQILAAYVYKNALRQSSLNALNSQVFGRTPFNAKEYEAVFGPLAQAEAHGGFMKLKYFSQSVPYIQGLLLYLLAISFPFFCVFLVLPGKAPSFFVWCSLWVWVKSWDVGFAMVNVARDVLWHLVQERVSITGENPDWTDPVSIMSIIFHNDPYMTQNTYWEMACLLTCAVPFVTAHLCLGATGLYDMFKSGIDHTADRFRTAETNASKRYIGNQLEHDRRVLRDVVGRFYAEASEGAPPGGNGSAEGLTTMSGRPVDRQGGARARERLGHYLLGQQFAQTGHQRWFDKLSTGVDRTIAAEQVAQAGARQAAAAKGQTIADKDLPTLAHPLRGMVSFESYVQPHALKGIYGSLENASGVFGRAIPDGQQGQYVNTGVTWAQLFDATTMEHRHLSSVLGGLTGRHQDNQARKDAYNIGQQITLRQGTDFNMRDPAAAADNLNPVLSVFRALQYFSHGDSVNRGGVEPGGTSFDKGIGVENPVK